MSGRIGPIAVAFVGFGVASCATMQISPNDADFMITQCGIQQSDVDVISRLHRQVQIELANAIAKRDCGLLVPFKNARDHIREIYRDPPLLKDADVKYITDGEYNEWVKMIE